MGRTRGGRMRVGVRGPGFVLPALAAAVATSPVASEEDGGYHTSSASAGLIGWAARGRLDKVTSMLAQRADVQAKDAGGGTPLHAAAMRGHIETLRLLRGKHSACLKENTC